MPADDAAAAFPADGHRHLDHAREHRNRLGARQQVVRNPLVGHLHDGVEGLGRPRGLLGRLLHFLVARFVGSHRWRESSDYQGCTERSETGEKILTLGPHGYGSIPMSTTATAS